MKIDFGCGNKLEPGWVGCDVRPLPGVRFIMPAWDITSVVEASSVEKVKSRHFLEHLTIHQARRTAAAWRVILQPGGRCDVIVPSLSYHLAQLRPGVRHRPSDWNPSYTNLQHAMAALYGWQQGADYGVIWDIHRSAWDELLLRELLTNAGFVDVWINDNKPWNLDMTAFAPSD